jgi:hypothetical protein
MAVVVLVSALSAGLLAEASAKPSAPGSGNSTNAKQCQKGGWRTLFTSTGGTFTSQDDCVAYAAGGGTISDTPTHTLTVSKAGTGSGNVTGAGIDCGSDCSENYPQGDSVTLTAEAGTGSTFAGWSGACTGTGTCTVTLDANKTATATFDLTPPPPQVTTPNVFLGYADTKHDVADFVPDPWAGDPGVVYLGCVASTPECGPDYNAGAIRIDNPAGNPPLTLTAASVDIGPCHFIPWDPEFLPATANAGESFVLTQTGLLGLPQPSPCDGGMPEVDRPFTNFATAAGPFDTHIPPDYNCEDPNLVGPPVINLTFSNGMTLTVTDAAKILNTGGVHRFACQGLDHGTAWTAVPAANVVRTP